MAANRVCRRAPGNVAAAVRRRYSDGDDVKFVESDKYKVFKDDESSVILDVEEERALLHSRRGDERSEYDEIDQFAGFDPSREYRNSHDIVIQRCGEPLVLDRYRNPRPTCPVARPIP